MADKIETTEEIEQSIKEIENDILRAFLTLYWEKGTYPRPIQIAEINRTLDTMGFGKMDTPTRLMLLKALQIAKNISARMRAHR